MRPCPLWHFPKNCIIFEFQVYTLPVINVTVIYSKLLQCFRNKKRFNIFEKDRDIFRGITFMPLPLEYNDLAKSCNSLILKILGPSKWRKFNKWKNFKSKKEILQPQQHSRRVLCLHNFFSRIYRYSCWWSLVDHGSTNYFIHQNADWLLERDDQKEAWCYGPTLSSASYETWQSPRQQLIQHHLYLKVIKQLSSS